MKALIKKPGFPLEQVEIEDSLETFQGIVEGYIEAIPHPVWEGSDISCYGNEEAKLKQLPPNIVLTYNYKTYDVICGTVVFVGYNPEDGGNKSLTPEQIEVVEKSLFERLTIENHNLHVSEVTKF